MNRSDYDQAFIETLNMLNTAQRKAVDTVEGPVLVVAGPGTGKTQILSARIGHILRNTDTAPHNILCLTYTDAGTLAMRKRLLSFIGPEAYNVPVYTFHGFCNKVIQNNLDYFGVRELQPVSELERIEIVHEIIDGFDTEHPLKRLVGDIYYERKRLMDLFDTMKKEDWSVPFLLKRTKEFLDELPLDEKYHYKRKYSDKKTGKVYNAGDLNEKKLNEQVGKLEKFIAAVHEFDSYNNLLRKYKRYDYHDMLMWVRQAFEKHESLLLNYQEQFHYFLVDEFQDTNGIQNKLLEMLSSYWNKPNVFVVGDDDQSIFRFQGANVKNIMDFYDFHKGQVETIVLENNYRSTQGILDASKRVVDYNNERLISFIPGLTKELQSKGALKDSTELPRIFSFHSITHEEVFIVEEIKRLKEKKQDLNEIAVIYRQHGQVERLVRILEQEGIPLNIKKSVNILELPIINNLLNILRYLVEERDKTDSAEYLLYEIMHYQYFGIATRDINKIIQKSKEGDTRLPWRVIMSNEELLDSLNLSSKERIISLENNLKHWMQDLSNKTLQVLFEKIITKGQVIGYTMNEPDRNWQIQVISSFFNFMKDELAKNPSLSIVALLDMVDKMRQNNIAVNLSKVVHTEEGVHFVTAHSSKGLEYDHVYVIGCYSKRWEGKANANRGYTLPGNLVSNDDDITEEERRLFYVALTRARAHLTVSFANSTDEGKDLEPSRFVLEMKEGSELRIEHQVFDDNKIIEYQARIMTNIDEEVSNLIDHDLVDKELRHFSMSVTSLNKYLRCPLSFYFENIVRVPSARNVHMGFGSAVHYALELHFKRMLANDMQVFNGADGFMHYFEQGMKMYRSHFTDKEYEDRMLYARKNLKAYITHYEPVWNKNALVEYAIDNVEVNGIPLSGKLDKIEFEQDFVNVIDYKTGSSSAGAPKMKGPTPDEPQGQDYWRQLVFYKILVDYDNRNNWKVTSGEMDFVQANNKEQFVKRKLVIRDEDVELVKSQIQQVHDSIHKHKFDGCGEDDCQWCNFVKYNFKSEQLDLIEKDD